jgi:hypothetical protein
MMVARHRPGQSDDVAVGSLMGRTLGRWRVFGADKRRFRGISSRWNGCYPGSSATGQGRGDRLNALLPYPLETAIGTPFLENDSRILAS